MIYIREGKPTKISGLTSFYITFDYVAEIVDAIKSLSTFHYNKKDYSWEISVDELSDILDKLTFLGDIQLTLLPEHQELRGLSPLTPDEILSFKAKPFPHQVDAINYGLTSSGKWLLLDSMGLGKTLEIILYAETLRKRGLIDHCLIICGVDSLRQNWKNEIRKFSNLDCLVLGEKVSKKGRISYTTVNDRAEQLKHRIQEFFVIVNAATIRSDKFVDAFSKSENKFGLIAVDEAHKFATKTSQQGTNLLKLKSPYKVAATGSLITNSPLSAYMPLAWTENDSATLTMYKSQYCIFGGFGGNQVIGYKNLDTLKEELYSCMIRRTLDQVRTSMPPKTVETELVEMSDEHKKFYDAIVDGVKDEADKVQLNANNLLALTTRLRQATACPGILTSQPIVSTKIERAAELAQELLDQGEKVVIMSTFKDPVNQLASMLGQYDPLLGTGDIPDATVSENILEFQNNPDRKLFICTHSKCGTGVTLNAASYMICLDTPWTYANFSQSTDRIWRITNQRPAIIKVLICQDTIDERVAQIVDTKRELSDFVVDDVQNSLSASMKDEMLSIIKSL